MKKKILGALLCMMMLATIPSVAGIQSDAESEESLGLFSKTYVKGYIIGARTEGRTTSFFALRVKYTTYSLFGEDDSGIIMLQQVSFTGKFKGCFERFYVNGMFCGTI